ncbi:MAG: alpha-amylase [Oscillospiraceae bacterium]|nr:alpha-amylase [Oscillospiraceae bacterium]
MAWYNDAVFYHIYPLGMTGAPQVNDYGASVPRLRELFPWIDHIHRLGCNAIYIGPLFQSVGHGYETTDYKTVDSRLGTNEDFAEFVRRCHDEGIRVIVDGVFNHTGRDFFAFRDIREKREASAYRDWYRGVNFHGNNSFGDGFGYENWGGYDLLAKLNQQNGAVRDYICDVIRYWVRTFDIDGIRLDAADVMDHEYMKAMRRTANEVKADFWLMGEVIHGDYGRWVNGETLHSVTNYTLHKALYSSHNDHNYFELAHTVDYVNRAVGDAGKLYTFADNHDVERIASKLRNKAHLLPLYVLLYGLPGIPSIYYGSEFGIEGRKGHGAEADAPLRPMLRYEDYREAMDTNPLTKLLAALGRIRHETPALRCGQYRQLLLQTTHFAFSRVCEGSAAIVTVNNADHAVTMELQVEHGDYIGALTGAKATAENGVLRIELAANSGEIWRCVNENDNSLPVVEMPVKIEETAPAVVECPVIKEEIKSKVEEDVAIPHIPYEEMTVPQLQAVILSKMAKNGPVTDYMRRTVDENTHHGSLVNWARSF